MREHQGSMREHGGAVREQMNETGLSARAQFKDYYIYIYIYNIFEFK